MVVLLLTVFYMFLPSAITTVSPTCQPEKWLHHVGSKISCCDFCPPGQYMLKPCNTLNRTVCKPCPKDTFTATMNRYKRCLQCTECQDKAVVKIKCSREVDTQCSCRKEHFYNSLVQECQECRTCTNNEVVVQDCSNEKDRVCGKCQLGRTFSYKGKCKDCKVCKVSEIKMKNCNLTNDTVCRKTVPTKNPGKDSKESKIDTHLLVIILCVIFFAAIPTGIIVFCCFRKRSTHSRHGEGSSTLNTVERATQSLIRRPELPHVTTTSSFQMFDTDEDRRQTDDNWKRTDFITDKRTALEDLPHTVCAKLAKLLDPDFPENNWKSLACQMQMKRLDIKNLETVKGKSPTFLVIEEYQVKTENTTIEDLHEMLTRIGRLDAVAVIGDFLNIHYSAN